MPIGRSRSLERQRLAALRARADAASAERMPPIDRPGDLEQRPDRRDADHARAEEAHVRAEHGVGRSPRRVAGDGCCRGQDRQQHPPADHQPDEHRHADREADEMARRRAARTTARPRSRSRPRRRGTTSRASAATSFVCVRIAKPAETTAPTTMMRRPARALGVAARATARADLQHFGGGDALRDRAGPYRRRARGAAAPRTSRRGCRRVA